MTAEPGFREPAGISWAATPVEGLAGHQALIDGEGFGQGCMPTPESLAFSVLTAVCCHRGGGKCS
jgi:hypothetical protein